MKGNSFIVKGCIWTGDKERPKADYFRVNDGIISEVGDSAALVAHDGEKVYDFTSNLVTPGFTDAHIHLTAYAKLKLYRDLSSVSSIEELLAAVREEAAKTKKGDWVRCVNFNEENWAVKVSPNIAMLDEATPNNPVILSRYCGHKHIVNTAGFKKSGLYDSTDVNVVRDAEGKLTGVITEGGAGCIISSVAGEYETPQKIKELLANACRKLSSLGITAVHANDAPTYALGEELAAMQDLDDEGILPVRIHCYHDSMPHYRFRSGFGNDKISFAGLKIFADGCLGSHTAALFEPYSDSPETSGQLNHSDEEMYQILQTAKDRGIQVQIHAIGDKALDQVLTAIEKVIAVSGAPPLPFRINHAIVCPQNIIDRIAKTGSIVDLQPIQAHTDREMAPARLGPKRMENLYPCKSLYEAGVFLTGSSDAPIEDPNPWLSIWSSVTRGNFDGSPLTWYNMNEKLSLFSALEMYTVNAWKAIGCTKGFGVIKAGCRADFAVADGNPFDIPEGELYKVKNKATFLDGVLVWKDGDTKK